MDQRSRWVRKELEIGTEAKFEAVSATDGLYAIPFLPPGSYRLTAESPGFKRYVRDNFAAGANERLGVDIQIGSRRGH